MRKIDKDLILATNYKAWIDAINARGEQHPAYTSSKKYYNDIVANLLWVQGGLCAYTEMFLIDISHVDPALWEAGSLSSKIEFFGQLEHYDSTLKPERGWEWSNLFVVSSDVNVKLKRTKPVNYILKPDADHYDPFYFLEYDFKTHFFKPATARDLALQIDILKDINTLGLNFSPIIDHRKKYLKPIIDDVQLGQKSLEDARANLCEYYTAFEMSVLSLKLE